MDTPFASATDLTARHDWRTIARLATDSGSPLTQVEVETPDPNVLVALQDASAQIEAAMIAGGRYSIAELETLDDRAQQHLQRVTCWIAMAYLFERRPDINPDATQRFMDRAAMYLKQLAEGENLFNLTDQSQPVTPTIGGPTSVDIDNRNLLPERMARHFPVPTASRLPNDRG